MSEPEIIDAEEFARRYLTQGSQSSKYHSKRTEYRDEWYDSQYEAEVAAYLYHLREEGELLWVLRQVTVPLGKALKVRIDFLVEPPNGKCYGVEAKGFRTREWIIKEAAWAECGPFPLHVYSKGKTFKIVQGRQ